MDLRVFFKTAKKKTVIVFLILSGLLFCLMYYVYAKNIFSFHRPFEVSVVSKGQYCKGCSEFIEFVKFDSYQWVQINQGEKPNSCYTLSFQKSEMIGNQLKISLKEEVPGNACVCAMVITKPFVVLNMPKTSKKIVLDVIQTKKECL